MMHFRQSDFIKIGYCPAISLGTNGQRRGGDHSKCKIIGGKGSSSRPQWVSKILISILFTSIFLLIVTLITLVICQPGMVNCRSESHDSSETDGIQLLQLKTQNKSSGVPEKNLEDGFHSNMVNIMAANQQPLALLSYKSGPDSNKETDMIEDSNISPMPKFLSSLELLERIKKSIETQDSINTNSRNLNPIVALVNGPPLEPLSILQRYDTHIPNPRVVEKKMENSAIIIIKAKVLLIKSVLKWHSSLNSGPPEGQNGQNNFVEIIVHIGEIYKGQDSIDKITIGPHNHEPSRQINQPKLLSMGGIIESSGTDRVIGISESLPSSIVILRLRKSNLLAENDQHSGGSIAKNDLFENDASTTHHAAKKCLYKDLTEGNSYIFFMKLTDPGILTVDCDFFQFSQNYYPYTRALEDSIIQILGLNKWTDWGPCSSKCGYNGTQERQRKCVTTSPSTKTLSCEFEVERRSCNLFQCPVPFPASGMEKKSGMLDLLENVMLRHFPRGVRKLKFRPTAFEITRYATLMTPTSNIFGTKTTRGSNPAAMSPNHHKKQQPEALNLMLSFKAQPGNDGYLFTISSLKAHLYFGIKLGHETLIFFENRTTDTSHYQKTGLNPPASKSVPLNHDDNNNNYIDQYEYNKKSNLGKRNDDLTRTLTSSALILNKKRPDKVYPFFNLWNNSTSKAQLVVTSTTPSSLNKKILFTNKLTPEAAGSSTQAPPILSWILRNRNTLHHPSSAVAATSPEQSKSKSSILPESKNWSQNKEVRQTQKSPEQLNDNFNGIETLLPSYVNRNYRGPRFNFGKYEEALRSEINDPKYDGEEILLHEEEVTNKKRIKRRLLPGTRKLDLKMLLVDRKAKVSAQARFDNFNDVIYVKPDPIWLTPLNDGSWHSLAIFMNATHLKINVDCMEYGTYIIGDAHNNLDKKYQDYSSTKTNSIPNIFSIYGVTTLGSNFRDFPYLKDRFEGYLEHVFVSNENEDLTAQQCSTPNKRLKYFPKSMLEESMNIRRRKVGDDIKNDISPLPFSSNLNKNILNPDDEDNEMSPIDLGSGYSTGGKNAMMDQDSDILAGSGKAPSRKYLKQRSSFISTEDQRENPSSSSSDCQKRCLNGGVCSRSGECHCSWGYKGYNCSTPICDFKSGTAGHTNPNSGSVIGEGCLNGGTCVKRNTCSCPPEYDGNRCQTLNCGYESCIKNGGKCTSTGICLCPVGYLPPDCSPMCLPICQNGGKCVGLNTCACPDGYTGSRCQNEICSNLTCHNGGYCKILRSLVDDNMLPSQSTFDKNFPQSFCNCKFGFYGKFCEKKQVCTMMPFREKYQKVYILHVEDEALVPCKEWDGTNRCYQNPNVKQISKHKTFFRVKYRCVPLAVKPGLDPSMTINTELMINSPIRPNKLQSTRFLNSKINFKHSNSI